MMITGPFKTLPVTITDPNLLATTQRLLDARLLHQIHNGDCLAITHNGLDILYQYAFVKKDYWLELSFQFKWDHVLRLLNRYQKFHTKKSIYGPTITPKKFEVKHKKRALCQILLMGHFRRRPVLAPGAAFFQLPFPFDAIGSGR
ncbi:hypothetical protein LT982_02380 [Limosilactobacillus fermentum]|uniref:hypothetical protein n=1 Tax=Limosilactobacillus fermentum TaxID=1613 RepID=UPI002026E5C0|nr:hypothetical protein [Limosilactobacillus fermentum]URL83261.1 hypothetical protein LT982_02380 [Limosilactobacillus fermentum]